MMRASHACTLAALLGFLTTTEAFVVSTSAATVVRCRSLRRQETQQVAAAEKDRIGNCKTWDGKSWPAENEKRKEVPSETKSWEMEKTHVEVWEDLPNPVEQLAWWENYAPSQEEMDAAAKGFNWTTKWFESAGINPEEPPAAEKPSEE